MRSSISLILPIKLRALRCGAQQSCEAPPSRRHRCAAVNMDLNQAQQVDGEPTDEFIKRWRSREQKDPSSVIERACQHFSSLSEWNRSSLSQQAKIPQPELPGWQTRLTIDNQLIPRTIDNQYIPQSINPTREAFLNKAMLLSRSPDGGPGPFVEVPHFFASPRYLASFIFGTTLLSLGYDIIPICLKKVNNPRGGRFQPIGVATIYLKLENIVFFVNVLVLGGNPEDAGALFILGKPDIDRYTRCRQIY